MGKLFVILVNILSCGLNGHRECYTKIKGKGLAHKHESYLGGLIIWLRSDHRVYISWLENEEHA